MRNCAMRRHSARQCQADPKLSDIYTNNLAEVHSVIRRLRAMIDSTRASGC